MQGSVISDASYPVNNNPAYPGVSYQTCGPYTAEDIAINSHWVTDSATLVFFM